MTQRGTLADRNALATYAIAIAYWLAMKSVYDTRRTNLRSLIGQWGGPTSLSKKLGHSNGSYLAQLVGLLHL